MRFFLVVIAILALVLFRAPASLFDRLASVVSDGDVRVRAADGTIWDGRGTIVVMEATTRRWHRWHQVSWSFDPIGLFRGEIAWKIIIGQGSVSTLALGVAGWEAANLKLLGPASYFLQRLPGPMRGLGWKGDIQIETAGFGCSWRVACEGQAVVEWNDAESDFLPGLVFGSFRIAVQGQGDDIVLDWTSIDIGAVQTNGKGRLVNGRLAGMAGRIKGDALLLGRLPAVAGPWARPTASPDTWEIVYP